MTSEHEWGMAKWIKKHGKTKIADLPDWFGENYFSEHEFFSIDSDDFSEYGFTYSEKNSLYMSDKNIDNFLLERKRRLHAFRDWLEPVGVVIATIISIIALVVSIIALRLEFQSKQLSPLQIPQSTQSIHTAR